MNNRFMAFEYPVIPPSYDGFSVGYNPLWVAPYHYQPAPPPKRERKPLKVIRPDTLEEVSLPARVERRPEPAVRVESRLEEEGRVEHRLEEESRVERPLEEDIRVERPLEEDVRVERPLDKPSTTTPSYKDALLRKF
jgi:hypothetical protein